jgi:hypothetical protein
MALAASASLTPSFCLRYSLVTDAERSPLGRKFQVLNSSQAVGQVAVALESGPQRRVFAQARDWIGWCRAEKDEAAALAALLAAGPRYALVAAHAGLPLTLPVSLDDLIVFERVPGTAVTDFGALSVLLASDTEPLDETRLERLERLLVASWATFDEALAGVPAEQRDLKPTRGRAPDATRLHLLEADLMHLSAFGPAFKPPKPDNIAEQEARMREQMLAGLRALPLSEPFAPRPRYGFSWTPHFAVRRSAWHALDHAWELQDRKDNLL